MSPRRGGMNDARGTPLNFSALDQRRMESIGSYLAVVVLERLDTPDRIHWPISDLTACV